MSLRTVVVAPDSFKGSLTAREVGAAMASGLRAVWGDDIRIIERPLADGGEGTLQTFLDSVTTSPKHVRVHDAYGRPRSARYGLSLDGRLAVIEAAEANGLPHVTDVPLVPLEADSYGVGEIVLDVLDAGAEEILLCIGGSATTDGGTGILRALGARFLDADGRDIPPGGGSLSRLTSIDLTTLDPRARRVRWRIATDVRNPLCGANGAAAVFGPQKGATPTDVESLDAGLQTLATALRVISGIDVTTLPGAGAGGGVPAALHALLGADLVPGFDVVADIVGLESALARASLVITGEGSFDSQSLDGKVVGGVVRYAPRSCPVVVVAGTVELPVRAVRAAGVAAAFSIAQGPARLRDLQADAADLVRETTSHIASIMDTEWHVVDSVACLTF